MPRTDNIVETARTWIGTPWVHQGRSIYGIDCAGLIVVVGKKIGYIPDSYKYNNYQRHTTGANFLIPFKDMFARKPVSRAAPGDIMLFRDGMYPCHCAILGDRDGELTIIHADALRKKVLEERLSQGQWFAKRVACFEFKEG